MTFVSQSQLQQTFLDDIRMSAAESVTFSGQDQGVLIDQSCIKGKCFYKSQSNPNQAVSLSRDTSDNVSRPGDVSKTFMELEP